MTTKSLETDGDPLEPGEKEDVLHQIVAGDIEMLRNESTEVLRRTSSGAYAGTTTPTATSAAASEKEKEAMGHSGGGGSNGDDVDDKLEIIEEAIVESEKKDLKPKKEEMRPASSIQKSSSKGGADDKFRESRRRKNSKDDDDEEEIPRTSDASSSAPGAQHVRGRAFGSGPTSGNVSNNISSGELGGDEMEEPDNIVTSTEEPSQEIVKAAIVNEEDLEADFKNRMMNTMVEATEVIPESDAQDKKESEPVEDQSFWKRNKCVIISGLVLCGVLALILGLTLGGDGDDDGSSNEALNKSPTDVPSMAPSLSDRGYLQQLFVPISGGDVDIFDDATTPQAQALNWLTMEDTSEAMLDARATNTSTLIERYVMAVLYYSTGGPEWNEQLRFLSNYSICDWPNIGDNETEVRSANEVDCDDNGNVVKLRIGT